MTNEQSCGALVYHFHKNKREFLMIKHQNGGHVGFPKGHIEHNEKHYETAKREVFEETGIKAFIDKTYRAYTSYSPAPDKYKELTYFIGRPITENMTKQIAEVSDVFWCEEDQVLEKLTYQNDRDVFLKLYKDILNIEKDVPMSLFTYIEDHILPQYDQFDEGHHRDHIFEVVKASFDLVNDYPARKDMVYLVACFHDLGLQFGRKTHHITSGELLQKDPYVLKHYHSDEIQIMVDAIFDHRASNTEEPRSIYGKILAEADRLLDVDKVIERTVQYELHKHPNLDLEGQIKHAFDHIIDKYGDEGYLKRYLDYEPNKIGEKALKQLTQNHKLLYDVLKNTFEAHKLVDE